MNELDKEIAEKVVLPKLQKIAAENEVTSIAQMRKFFNEMFEESISASRFQNWIDLLEIKFVRKVVIEWPSVARPLGRATEVPTDEEPVEDDEMTNDFPAIPPTAMGMDAFGQMQ
jgi:hypothetical protein